MTGQENCGSYEAVEIIEPGHRVAMRLLDDKRARPVGTNPLPELTAGFGKPPRLRQAPEREHPAVGEAPAGEDGEAEFTEAGIEGEEGIRFLGHVV